MPTNITNTQICNQALGKVGGNRISNLDSDTSAEAMLCRDLFEEIRDTVLEEGRWSFSRVGRSSNTNGRIPAPWKYEYAYPIPQDILLVLRVYPSGSKNARGELQAQWELNGGFILTDLEKFDYDATVRVTDPRLFNTTFRQALVYRLAAELAIPITQNEKLFELYEQMYQRRLAAALAIDGMQGINERLNVSSMVTLRRANY